MSRVICQLGIGGHVDHILVRQAAEQLGAETPPYGMQPTCRIISNSQEELAPQVAGMKTPASHNGGRLEGLGRGGAGLSVTITLIFENPENF